MSQATRKVAQKQQKVDRLNGELSTAKLELADAKAAAKSEKTGSKKK